MAHDRQPVCKACGACACKHCETEGKGRCRFCGRTLEPLPPEQFNKEYYDDQTIRR